MKSTILLFLTFLAFMRTIAVACSCGPTPPVSKAFAQASAVFVGRCISSKLVYRRPNDLGGAYYEYTFEVARSWKGVAGKKETLVKSGIGGGDCGYPFQIGESYILYCYGDNGILRTNVCARTCIANSEPKAETEMNELDEAKGKAK